MTTQHIEQHFLGGKLIRDIVIGMSDGLTVPFALAAGLAGAVDSNTIVITAGLAEIAAGSIAMGLGGFLAARSEDEHYRSEHLREVREVEEVPEKEFQEIVDLMQEYGVSRSAGELFATELRKDKTAWVDFMMRFELGLEKPEPKQAYSSAGTIGFSYIVGGLIPLLPYMIVSSRQQALLTSVGVTLAALFIFGFIKGRFTGKAPLKSALETTLVGGLAAGVAFTIARFFA